ncbi:MAG: UDP-N-acetylmuramoyl-L-alanine--D-glutamate ligase [Bacteroidota bacterium]
MPHQPHSHTATVIGAARSGLAAARLLASRGTEVFLTDAGPVSAEAQAVLETAGVAFEAGGHTDRALDTELVVLSPGVPTQAPIVQNALGRGIRVVSEIELASWHCADPIVAITGSNGKTTTTSLIGHVFETAGRPYTLAGNIGRAFSDAVLESRPAETVMVLEVSSFQLDHIDTFRPRVSVLLNVTPDHLNRYAGYDAYFAAKLRIFENQRTGDVLVYNYDDEPVREAVLARDPTNTVHAIGFSQHEELDEGAFLRGDQIVYRTHQTEASLMYVNELALPGRHNLYNSLAAAVAARAMEVRSDVLRESLMRFEGVPHRLELVRTLNDVRYVNDSKATNVNAVWYALESFERPIVLIAGGRDKGNDYSSLFELTKAKTRGVVAIGESGEKVMTEFAPHTPQTVRAFTMQEAIDLARDIAQRGDVVLLSPACASFDMYANYEERGDTFRRLVKAL